MNRRVEYVRMLRKNATAVLTPEAEQAAMQPPMDPSMGGMPPQGAPMDPSMMGGAPMDPSMMGGAPMDPSMAGMAAPQGSGGGQLPPEILQDQMFLSWLQSQGIMLDPSSGMFIGPDGQPLPAEAIMEAYAMYQQQMGGAQGMPPQGAAPADPSMMGGMPPQDQAMGGMPQAPAAMQGMDPGMAQKGAPGQIPPEILQDQGFMDFMQGMIGLQFDQQSGQFLDPQSGAPVPPDMVVQAYQQYQMQAQQGGMQQGGMPPEGAPEGMPPEGMSPEAQGMGASPLPPELLTQFQSTIDDSLKAYTASLEKKLEMLADKLDAVTKAVDSLRDTDDRRTAEDKDEDARLRDDIAAELTPTVKTASVKPLRRPQPKAPVNLFSVLTGRK